MAMVYHIIGDGASRPILRRLRRMLAGPATSGWWRREIRATTIAFRSLASHQLMRVLGRVGKPRLKRFYRYGNGYPLRHVQEFRNGSLNLVTLLVLH